MRQPEANSGAVQLKCHLTKTGGITLAFGRNLSPVICTVRTTLHCIEVRAQCAGQCVELDLAKDPWSDGTPGQESQPKWSSQPLWLGRSVSPFLFFEGGGNADFCAPSLGSGRNPGRVQPAGWKNGAGWRKGAGWELGSRGVGPTQRPGWTFSQSLEVKEK